MLWHTRSWLLLVFSIGLPTNTTAGDCVASACFADWLATAGVVDARATLESAGVSSLDALLRAIEVGALEQFGLPVKLQQRLTKALVVEGNRDKTAELHGWQQPHSSSPPPPSISQVSTRRFPMEADGPPITLCTKPPLRVRAGEVASAKISQPGVSLRWPTVPGWEPQNSPARDFALKTPKPTGDDGCYSIDPGATAAPGPAHLSVEVGNLSSFSTKVEYYESISTAFGRRPFIAEPVGVL
eukprot:SAG31_NODE_11902_length_987_cov_1.672297_1_plen_241_part_01